MKPVRSMVCDANSARGTSSRLEWELRRRGNLCHHRPLKGELCRTDITQISHICWPPERKLFLVWTFWSEFSVRRPVTYCPPPGCAQACVWQRSVVASASPHDGCQRRSAPADP